METFAIKADLIASVVKACHLSPHLLITPYIVAQEGYALAVRALDEKETYNQLECIDQSFHTIHKGDIIVGALGERMALRGYSGRIPRRIKAGDILHILNMGGIIGKCTSDHPDLGPPLRVEVLGAVIVEEDGLRKHATIQDHALEPAFELPQSAPLIMVSGTAMNSGKTFAAAQIIRGLAEKNLRIGAAKLTGAALLRDTRMMEEHGAFRSLTFIDAGFVSTVNKDVVPIAKGLIQALNEDKPDVIVLELGDGIMGPYGVDTLLRDKELQRFTRAHIVAALDPVGVWAIDHLFRTQYHAPVTAIVGPVTDNEVGKRYVEGTLGIPARNAMREPKRLAALVHRSLSAPTTNTHFGFSTSTIAHHG